MPGAPEVAKGKAGGAPRGLLSGHMMASMLTLLLSTGSCVLCCFGLHCCTRHAAGPEVAG